MSFSPDLELLAARAAKRLRRHRLDFGCGSPPAGRPCCERTMRLTAIQTAARVILANREIISAFYDHPHKEANP